MIYSIVILLILPQSGDIHCDRGTIGRPQEDTFQLLIAGGVLPTYGKYVRNLVSLRTRNYIHYHGDNHFCTGIIMSSKTIMTAAHCVTDNHKSIMHARSLLVVFGAVYRLETYAASSTRRVNKIMVHPRYRRYKAYDVAVMRLESRIPTNYRNVKPINRKSMQLSIGMKCVTLGWGQVYPHGPYANEIMYLDVIIRSPKFCKQQKYFEKQGTICVEPLDAGEICAGDMGGPLMCNDRLAGLIGGSEGCQGIRSLTFINYSSIETWVEATVQLLGAKRKRVTLMIFMLFMIHFI